MPEFVNLEHDLENRRISMTVEDSNVKQQKEMWGAFFNFSDTICKRLFYVLKREIC